MGKTGDTKEKNVQADPIYGNAVVSRFVGRMMLDGKKTVSYKNIYGALDLLKEKGNDKPLDVFLKAIDNVKPPIEVKSRRVGGSTYQVPVAIDEKRQEALAMRWVIKAARARSGKTMSEKLCAEFLDASNSTGAAFKKKEDTHRMAEANKAFSHYRF